MILFGMYAVLYAFRDVKRGDVLVMQDPRCVSRVSEGLWCGQWIRDQYEKCSCVAMKSSVQKQRARRRTAVRSVH